MAPHATGGLWPERNGQSPPRSSRILHTGVETVEPIAIVGYSLKFPQDATSSDAFWKIMMEKRNTATAFPKSRMNINGMYHPDVNRRGQIPLRQSHFIHEDLGAFDAAFFSTSATDAGSMDPQQRLLLEYTYKALENAGMPMETVSGTKTSVYTGTFSTDWQHLAYKDGEQCGITTALGVQACFNANRISWFFNLTGNSANIDTACSSSLVCLHLGCQGLRSGEEYMSIVAGSNLILSPDNVHSLTNLNMLSPDGQCYSFDHRGNGYSRGEGFGVLILKRVSDAIRDSDTIRGIIRSTGCNQDGNTPSITLPNSLMQELLIKETYKKANLSMEPTRFFEAHGTGTSVGDPIESKALGSAFRHVRTGEDPLWVGALKSNVGHLEGASGIAGVIKALLVLEKSIIPPNTNFEKVNPKIDTDFLHIKFPLEPIPWPSKGLRRASVNSFGNAGTNAHVILDDVFHFLEERGLSAHHLTVRDPSELTVFKPTVIQFPDPCIGISIKAVARQDSRPRLLLLSSGDETGIKRQVSAYMLHFSKMEIPDAEFQTYLNNLEFTLAFRRSSLAWKSFAVARSLEDLRNLDEITSKAKKDTGTSDLAFIFTGQGSQWAGMGRELMAFPVFQQSLLESENYLLEIGCQWRLSEEMFRVSGSRINTPELSQPIGTALQIALVQLLGSLNVFPVVVIGHSSGEIAAACSTGAISAKSALRLAYHRGRLAEALATSHAKKGSMTSVELSSEDVLPYLSKCAERFGQRGLTIACINSPKNITVSGDEDQINGLKEMLDSEKILSRKLKIDVAYHSPHMQAIAEDYRLMIQDIQRGSPPLKPIAMISSVSGKKVSESELLSPNYWVSNLVSLVRFDEAVEDLFARSVQKVRKKLDFSHRNNHHVNMLVEIGPHAVLERPIKEILMKLRKPASIGYVSLMVRNNPANDSLLNAIGSIKCLGYPLKVEQLSPMGGKCHDSLMALPDLPEYEFDHSKQYWDEPRLSYRYRTQEQGKLDLLGKPVTDWNHMEAAWRNHIRASEMPWVEDHVINSALIYPAAGMLVMAIEAADQLADPNSHVVGFELKEVSFLKPLTVVQEPHGTETKLTIHMTEDVSKSLSSFSEFRLFAYQQDDWQECCRGYVRTRYLAASNDVDRRPDDLEELEACRRIEDSISRSCQTPIESDVFYRTLHKSGFGLGLSFQRIVSGTFGDQEQAQGIVGLYEWPESNFPQPHVVHPTSLDAIFHFAIVGRTEGGLKGTSTMIPSFLRRMFVAKNGLSFPSNDQVRESAWKTGEDSLAAEFSGFGLSAAGDSVLVQFDELKLIKIGDFLAHAAEEQLETPQRAYYIEHRPDPDLLDPARMSAYCEQMTDSSDSPFERYLDVMAHKHSDLRILAAGFEDAELHASLLRGLSTYNDSNEISFSRYSSFCFTAPVQSDVDQARDQFQAYPYTRFCRLDLGRDPSEGLEDGLYNIVLAAKTVEQNGLALRQINKMLSSDGKLVLYIPCSSFPDNEKPITNGFGNFLTESGFEEEGLELNMANATKSLKWTIWVHGKTQDTANQAHTPQVFLVLDRGSATQTRISEALAAFLQNSGILDVAALSLEEASTAEQANGAIFVVLLEADQSFLYSLCRDAYCSLQRFLVAAKSVVWIDLNGGSVAGNPEHSLVYGLARALRSEYDSYQFSIVCFEGHADLSDLQLRGFLQVLRRNHIERSAKAQDAEYLEVNGMLTIPRLVKASDLSLELLARSMPRTTGVNRIEDAPPLVLTIGSVGLLDTLHFAEDKDSSSPLAADEVEIQTKAIGMNFKDCLSALGQIKNTAMGQECAGVVTRAGPKTRFMPGNRIVLAAADTFKTLARGKAHGAFLMPDDMAFTTAAAIPTQFGTAWEVIHKLARLRRGESILIHAAAGGTGQAAIQIAKSLGATVFATVGSRYKKQLLIDEYQIPAERIFYSRDTSFARKIKRKTNERGVDVIINSLVGEGLLASWDCIAPYGRFIEIGKKDIMSNSSLPMFAFCKNASFISFDGSLWLQDNPLEASRDLETLIEMFAMNKIHVPRPLHVRDISEVEKVFRLVQEGASAGKFVFEITKDSQVLATLDRKRLEFDPNATYVLAGGLGGLGRATCRWMVSNGARSFILLSRFGARTEMAFELLDELRSKNVRVEAPACDITDSNAMQETFTRLKSSMPTIKGCLQACVVTRDCLFKDMDYGSWQVAVDCKTVGSWNLHKMLPSGMDFFIILSSGSGLAGFRGQTNYDAGNTYQDAFARWRTGTCGQKTVALDLGAMIDDGILAENPKLLNRVLGYGTLEPISRCKYFAILDYFCNPRMPLRAAIHSQIAIGLGVGGGSGLESGTGHEGKPMLWPLAVEGAKMATDAAALGAGGPGNAEAAAVSNRDLLATSTSLDEAAAVVSRAVVSKLGKSLLSMQEAEAVDARRPLQMYGVDSLLAIELRNWIVKEFLVEIAVFETQGASTLETLSMLVAGKSEIKHEKWSSHISK